LSYPITKSAKFPATAVVVTGSDQSLAALILGDLTMLIGFAERQRTDCYPVRCNK
jgi:hypothetical protein